MKTLYTNYEIGETHTKENWLKWYDENGDKDNFSSSEDWFNEMLKTNLLAIA